MGETVAGGKTKRLFEIKSDVIEITMGKSQKRQTGKRDATAKFGSYLRPFRIELSGLGGVVQGLDELAHLDVRRGPVGVQDVVGGVEGDGLAVEPDGEVKVAGLARRVGLADLLEEDGLVLLAQRLTVGAVGAIVGAVTHCVGVESAVTHLRCHLEEKKRNAN